MTEVSSPEEELRLGRVTIGLNTVNRALHPYIDEELQKLLDSLPRYVDRKP